MVRTGLERGRPFAATVAESDVGNSYDDGRGDGGHQPNAPHLRSEDRATFAQFGLGLVSSMVAGRRARSSCNS